jgi:hypothetical protein
VAAKDAKEDAKEDAKGFMVFDLGTIGGAFVTLVET